MKKHIKKKFLNECPLPPAIKEKYLNGNQSVSQEDIDQMKVKKDSVAFLMTDTTFFQAFQYNYQGKVRLIPEPDPVLVYFHWAYVNYKQIREKRKNILKPLLDPVMGEPMINQWYEYFGLCSGFIIYLFTTLEAFINRSIPKEFVYKRVEHKKTELYNKHQIEEFLDFNEKMKKVLPEASGKDFFKAHPPTSQHLTNLKEFRDSIVHTKMSKDGVTYDYLFKKSLDFKYDETIDAVAAYCNFYHPDGNYIAECDCDKDW